MADTVQLSNHLAITKVYKRRLADFCKPSRKAVSRIDLDSFPNVFRYTVCAAALVYMEKSLNKQTPQIIDILPPFDDEA